MNKMNNTIKKILIANRGEIASRIIFTCKTNGIKTVAIYSSEDCFMQYVYQADENLPLSLSGSQAYLNQEEIIEIAKKTKVDAIHPGYGFLSENAQFAKKVTNAGIIWIGPKAKSIKLMGDKITSREVMRKAGVPVAPGFFFFEDEQIQAKQILEKIGFPLLLKDPLGGGGRAIKKVERINEFDQAASNVLSEAKKLTGSNQILLEKYIENGRHIEIQIAGDGKNFIHLFERECSIQRRHQKIIEETPCNFVNKNTLDKMYDAAILAAKAVNYKNIGTVEFIVTPNQNFYFLEMNTRLQVEHSITELATGIDLVNLQIQIAQTGELPYKQNQITQQAHAIECRVYAEDVENNFIPNSGKINNLQLPHGPFIRVDHNLEEGHDITAFFDPMICKITTWGKDRNLAIKNMLQALYQLNIDGIKTNSNFLSNILQSEEFLKGNIHTQLLSHSKYFKKLLNKPDESSIATESEKELAADIAKAVSEKINLNAKQTSLIKNNWKEQKWQ